MTRVKICGITRRRGRRGWPSTLGASARRVRLLAGEPALRRRRRARGRSCAALPPFVTPVGVFVDQPAERRAATWRRCVGLGAVQLHGDETPGRRRALGRAGHQGACRWTSRRAGRRRLAGATSRCCSTPHDPARRGGTGRTVDWARGRGVARGGRVVLAGGLTPDNVGDADRARCGRSASTCRRASSRRPASRTTRRMRAFFARSRRSGGESRRARTRVPAFGRRDPDARGYFGAFGGRFVPETLVAPLEALERGVPRGAGATRRSRRELDRLLRHYVGRPTPLYEARAARARRGGARDLPQARGPRPHRRAQDQQRARPGAARRAHGQAPRHRRDRRRASTASRPPRRARCSGSSATSTWAPRTWRGRRSTSSACGCSARRVRRVDAGSRTLKDAINEAMRDWVANVGDTLLPARLGARPASRIR